MAEEKDLIKKRASFKGRLTLFSNYLANLEGSVSESQVKELQLRIDRINNIFEQYDEVQFRLECMSEDMESQLKERNEFESQYYRITCQAQSIVTRFTKSSEANSGSDKSSSRANNNSNNFVKLPTIQLPKFSGSYDNWLEFHDTFSSLIHCNDEIDNINKFHYLRASLEGTAAVVIQSIEFSAKTYPVAWKILCERFDNKRLLIQNHVTALFNIDSITKESSVSIKRMIDQLNKNLRALDSLGEPTKHWDTLLIHIVTQKLDSKTYREWEELKGRLSKDEPLTFDVFLKFLRNRADLLEALELSRHNTPVNSGKSNTKIRSLVSITSSPLVEDSSPIASSTPKTCLKCKGEHQLKNCPQFLGLNNEQRLKLLPNYKICYNCLHIGHYANQCKKPGCRICKRKHNTLIHVTDSKSQSPVNAGSLCIDGSGASDKNLTSNITLSAYLSNSYKGNHDVLLSTALVKLYDSHKREYIARALLDSGSTSCLITENMCNKLSLRVNYVEKTVLGINNCTLPIGKMCNVQLKSLYNNYCAHLTCFVLPSIISKVPYSRIDISMLNIESNINLADPNFYIPSDVDLIIGADLFWDLLGSNIIKSGTGKPILFETKLGWIVSGPTLGSHVSNRLPSQIKCNVAQIESNNNSVDSNEIIQENLSRFWQLEEITNKSSYYSEEEKMCEEHFVNNTSRLPDGRFCVRIPLKHNVDCLGESYQRAKNCFYSLERRLNNQPLLKTKYHEFMLEYLTLGHMSKSDLKMNEFSYFIPHHGVWRDSSSTTKLRVVFNASSPTTTGVSFNEIQMVGPTIQDDLLSILLRFRQHKYILSADVEKMYRQIAVHSDDRYLQQIIWRNNTQDPLEIYKLNTVTYGTASAPFLAVRCLKQIGLDCSDPKITDIILHDFYMDDLLTGSDTVNELLFIRKGVTDALNSAQMPLRKWKSNVSDLDDVEVKPLDLNIGDKSNINSVLGLGWQSFSDELCFNISNNIPVIMTKRNILSVISQIFDPLGLLAPCIISVKCLLQKLWLQKLSWDDPLPVDIMRSWKEFINYLPILNDLRIARTVLVDSYKFIDLHIFSDASQYAFGACLYVCSGDENRRISVRLLMAKSRVAPIKPTTIPRLELCGALVGVRLYEKALSALRIKVRRTFFWTDSTIVLGWLKTLPSKLQPFVRNRVAEILEKSNKCLWNYVPSKNNPADHISRGVDAKTLVKSLDIWWSGPSFLKYDMSQWPSLPTISETLPELRNVITANVAVEGYSDDIINFTKFSNYSRLKRTMAYVLRFIKICKREVVIKNKYFTLEEFDNALNVLIRISQKQCFLEYDYLLNNKTLPSKYSLIKLNIFLDEHKIIRVGGRLEHGDFSFNKKHPILIHSKHPFTKLLFQFEHKRLLHAGPQLLLSTIKESFWPIGGRNLAKLCYRQCMRCARVKPKIVTPLMGNLPQQRVSVSYPFENVGLDYAGPVMIISRQGRGCRLVKTYIAIFVCFSTKAIHIELVGDLTSNCFLLALRRFMSRRGKPKNIYSDNGTSFVGAYNDIANFLKNCSGTLSETAADEGVKFHFTPPYSPHYNGLSEASVKSTKFHLQRVLGNCNLTYEELYSLLVQIEAVLNSRPLTHMSMDPGDLTPLTPGHFIIGRPLTSLPSPNYEDKNINRLTRYQRIEQLRQQFWKRWSREYISELQTRSKWRTKENPLKLNSLVIIKDDHLPPLKWKLGRIVNIYPGTDGVVRVADIKTSSGIMRRAFSKICPLPQPEDC